MTLIVFEEEARDTKWRAVIDSAPLVYQYINDVCWFDANLARKSEHNEGGGGATALSQPFVLMLALLHGATPLDDVNSNDTNNNDDKKTHRNATQNKRVTTIDAPFVPFRATSTRAAVGGNVELCRATMTINGALRLLVSNFNVQVSVGIVFDFTC
jgi:hypothetical protein